MRSMRKCARAPALARSGVGTIIGRRSSSRGREYTRVWIYVPTKVKEDTAFPFEAGDPCLVEIDAEGGGLIVRSVSVEEAVRLRARKEKD